MNVWQGRQGHVLPALLDGRTCLVVLQRSSASLSAAARRRLTEALANTRDPGPDIAVWAHSRNGSLGACGWLVAYGLPGRGVRAWLDSTGWRAASSAEFRNEVGARDRWLRESNVGAQRLVMDGFLQGGIYGGHAALAAHACALGATRTCARFIHAAQPNAVRDGDLFVTAFDGELFGFGSVLALDPRSRMLDDLRHEIGHDKMGQLWRDDRPLPEAFAAATGLGLGAWTERWMAQSILGRSSTFGPLPPWRPLLVLALPGFALLGLALVRASRRGMGPIH